MAENGTAILHVGTYKTGSSSIQNLLHHNRERLAGAGVLYPRSGLVQSDVVGYRHRGLLHEFIEGRTDGYAADALREELAATAARTVVLSSEAWSNPRFLPMLGGMAAELGDLGFGCVAGVVFLRRLIDYKVSHYHEFTWNIGNRLPFASYVVGKPGMFDYLFLVRAFRAVFGAELRVVNCARITDSADAFLDAAGLSALRDGLEPVPRANVRKVGALGIEVVRMANAAGMKRGAAHAFLRGFEARHPDLFAGEWTERTAPDRPLAGAGYRRELARALGWPPAEVDALLADAPPRGRPVAEAAPLIAAALQAAPERVAVVS